jgi:hypothetical protein
VLASILHRLSNDVIDDSDRLARASVHRDELEPVGIIVDR